MQGALSALDSAMGEIEHLRRGLRENARQVQVRSSDERAFIKSTALAWFNNHRAKVAEILSDTALARVDNNYKTVLESSARNTSRTKYLDALKELKAGLIGLRTDCLSARPIAAPTPDRPPDFSPLISDPAMQQILVDRWDECLRCLGADASLAATVMMGGLLEALLLARINREKDKSRIFTSKQAPKDKAGKTRQLSEWTLQHYIEVVHDMKWISVSAKDVGAVLRDYRNYVHPYKQLSHNVHLTPDDATLFWQISKMIARQVIASVS